MKSLLLSLISIVCVTASAADLKTTGESYNTGLVSVADRPWKDMLAEMMRTNHSIYGLLQGKRPSFAWDDPRFRVVAK